MWLVPPFGTPFVAVSLRMACALIFSLLIAQLQTSWSASFTLVSFAVAAGREAIIGLALAFLVALVFAAIFLAADLIRQQMGQEMIEEELEEEEQSTITSFFSLFGVLVFYY